MKMIEATFLPHALLVKVNITPPTQTSRWGLTLPEARLLRDQLDGALRAAERFAEAEKEAVPA